MRLKDIFLLSNEEMRKMDDDVTFAMRKIGFQVKNDIWIINSMYAYEMYLRH